MPTPQNTPTGFAADALLIEPWPAALCASSQTLQLVPNSTAFENAFSGAVSADELPGTAWKLAASFQGLDRVETAELRTLVARLRGSAGRFYYPANPGTAPAPQAPAGAVATSGPRLVQRGSTGELVVEDAEPARLGDYLSLDDVRGVRHLFLVLEDAPVNAQGQATYLCAPLPPDAFNAGVSVQVSNASGVFLLTDDTQGQITDAPGGGVNATLSAVEFLRPSLSIGGV